MNWYIKFGLVVLINLFCFIWLTRIDYKNTIRRSRRKKRRLWMVFVYIMPVVLFLYMIKFAYSDYLGFFSGSFGIWFSVSQIKYANEHAGVSNLVIPICTIVLMASVILTAVVAFGII